MSEKEWAVAYTDEQYLLRSEVVKAMNTTLIDGYWADIVTYRKSMMISLPFKTITNHFFFLTASEAIKAKITQFELASARFANLIKKLNDPREKEQAERACELVSLRIISTIENAQMGELSLKALLNDTYQEANPFHAPVIGYQSALKFYLHEKDLSALHPNEDFLAEALGKCLEVSELTRFYRTSDFDSYAQKARYLYNPDYNYAPFDYIEILMADFLSWVKRSDEVSYFVKAVAACYYLDYVMPFSERNDEIGALLAKAIYATSEVSREAFLIPFEAVLIKNPRYKALALETQRSGDLTYLVMYSISILTPLLESLSDEIKSIKIETYRQEFAALSPEEKAAATPFTSTPEAPKSNPEQLSLFNNESKGAEASNAPSPESKASEPTPALLETPTSVEPTPIPSPTQVKQAPTPKDDKAVPALSEVKAPAIAPEVAKEPIPQAPASKPEKAAANPERQISPEETSGGSALSIEENPLSEKEIKEYIQYLLETNPALNKNQASFLANHCTMGRYYTIQQFKKFTRCAYETARTSMDKLAQERYYSKLQVKNKFVYTPIKKGEAK